MQKNSTRTKTKIYCHGTICWRCVLSVLWTIKFCLTKVVNQAKPLKYYIKFGLVILLGDCVSLESQVYGCDTMNFGR